MISELPLSTRHCAVYVPVSLPSGDEMSVTVNLTVSDEQGDSVTLLQQAVQSLQQTLRQKYLVLCALQ